MGCNTITRVKSYLQEIGDKISNVSDDNIIDIFQAMEIKSDKEIIDSYIELYDINSSDFEVLINTIEDYSIIDPDLHIDVANDIYNSVFKKSKNIKNPSLLNAIKTGSMNSILFSVKKDIKLNEIVPSSLSKDEPSMYGLKNRIELNTFKRGLERLQSGTTLTKPQKEHIEKVTKFLKNRSKIDNNDNNNKYENFDTKVSIDTDIEGITINLPASGNYTYEKGDTYGRMLIDVIDETINSILGGNKYIGIFEFSIEEYEDEIITAQDIIDEVNNKISKDGYVFSKKEIEYTLKMYDKILTILKKNKPEIAKEFIERIDDTLKQYDNTKKENNNIDVKLNKLKELVKNSNLNSNLMVAILSTIDDAKNRTPYLLDRLKKSIKIYTDNSRNNDFKIIKKTNNGLIVFKDGKTTRDFNNKKDIFDFIKELDDLLMSDKNKFKYDYDLSSTLLDIIENDKKSIFFPLKIELAPSSTFSIGSLGSVKSKIDKKTGKYSTDRMFLYTFKFTNDVPMMATFTHELIHWFTASKINNDKEFRSKVRKLMNYTQQKVNSIYSEHKYSFKDEHEFLATIGDDHIFRSKLNSIKVDGRTLLQKITDMFKHFFIKTEIDPQYATVLSEALTLINEAVNNEEISTEIKLDTIKQEIMASKTKEEIIKIYNKYRRLGVSKEYLEEMKKYSKERKNQLEPQEKDILYSGDMIEYSKKDGEIRFKDGSEFKRISSYEEMFKAMNEYEAAMSMKYNDGKSYSRSKKRREHVLSVIKMISKIVPFREFDFNLYNIGSIGVYDPDIDMISMSQNKGTVKRNGKNYFVRNLSEAVLHEYIHNITSLGISSNPKLKKEIRKLMDLAEETKPSLKKNFNYKYAFTNEKEFIAELLSNQDLFEELSKIKTGNTTISNKIKNIFKYILNKLSKNDIENVSSSALNLFERAINSRNKIGKKENGDFYIKDNLDIESGSDNTSEMFKPENDDQVEFDRKVNLGEYVKTLYMNFLQQDNTGDWKYVTAQKLTPEFIENVNNILDKMTNFWTTYQKDYEVNLRSITVSEDEKYDEVNENRPTAGKHKAKVNKLTGKVESESIEIFWNPFQLNAAKSEIFLHETLHSLFQKAFSKEPKLGKNLEKLRNQMIKDGIDYTIFLEQNINSVQDENYTLSETEIQIAKNKFNYIFGKGTDIEEFAAYVYSNSYIYDKAINTKFKPSFKKGFKGIIDMIFYVIGSTISGASDSNKILNNTMEDIIKFRTKVIMEKEPETYKEALSFDTLKSISPLFGKSVESVGAFIDAANKVGVPINAKMIDGIKYMSDKIDDIISSKSDSIKKVTNFVTKLPIIKQVMETGLLQSIYLDYFEDTANGKYKDFYMRYRHGKALINKAVVDAKNSVFSALKDLNIYDSKNYTHGYNYYSKIIATGLHKNLSKINVDNLTKENIDNKLNEYLKVLSDNNIAKDSDIVKHLDALSAYLLDGKSHIENQQINVDNILNGYFTLNRKGFNQLSHKDYLNMVDMVEDYVSYKALSLMSDKDLSDLIVTLGNKEILKEMNELNTMYNSHVNNYNKINRSTDTYKSFTQKPMGFFDFDSNNTPYNLALISEDDLGLVDALRVTVVDKNEPIIILGKKYYKAKYSNIDVPFDEGMVSMVKYGSNGHSLSEIIRNHYLANGKTNSNVDFEVDNTIRLLAKNGGSEDFADFNKFIPEYDDNGRIIDYKLPISLQDKIVHLESDSNIDSVVPHTISKMLNVSQSNRLNRNTVDYLNEFFAKNKNDKSIDFVNIKSMNTDNKLASVWNRLNPDIKKYINESTKGEGVMVPEELIPLIFGVKQASLSNLDVFGKGPKRTPIKQAIKLSESILMETLGFFKGALTLYNADIFINNTISNMMVSWSYGISPIQYYKKFMKNWDLLTEFEKLNKIKIETQIKKSMGLDVNIQLAEIKRQMSSSKFNDIVKDGQFTPLIDDMEATSDGYLSHKINDKFRMDKNDEITKKRAKSIAAKKFMEPDNTKSKSQLYKEAMEELTKDRPLPLTANKIRKIAYGLSGSKVNEFATKFVMYGDTLTRQMILDKRIEKVQKQNQRPITSKEKQQILNELDMKLVNYGYNTNGLQSFTERVAGLFFTKYLFRAFKGYSVVMKQNPLSVVTQQLTQYGLDADVADPLDTYTKRGLVESLYNREQMKSPFDLAGNILSPNILMVTDFDSKTFVK